MRPPLTQQPIAHDVRSGHRKDENMEDVSDEESEAAKPKLSKAEKDKLEDIERRKALLPKKHRSLYQRIEKGEKLKEDNAKNLLTKRKALAKKKKIASLKSGGKKIPKKG